MLLSGVPSDLKGTPVQHLHEATAVPWRRTAV